MISTSDDFRVMLCSFDELGDLSAAGILPGDGYIRIGARTVAQVVGLILERLRLARGAPHPVGPAVPTAEAAHGGAGGDPLTKEALRVWRERLEHLLVAQAIASEAAQQFTLKKQIAEARDKIREFGGAA